MSVVNSKASLMLQASDNYQKHNMNDYRPISFNSVDDWQYQNGMKYKNQVDDENSYKMLRMSFFNLDKTNLSKANPIFNIEPNLFSTYFDHKKPIYITCEVVTTQAASYNDVLYLTWINPPISDTRCSWTSSGSETHKRIMLTAFKPGQCTYRTFTNKVGALKTTLHHLQARNQWEFLITDDSMEMVQLGTGFDARSIDFILLLWQE